MYFLTIPTGGLPGERGDAGQAPLLAPPLAVAHTAQLPLVNLPLESGELRPRVLRKEKERRHPFPLFFPLWLMGRICLSCL